MVYILANYGVDELEDTTWEEIKRYPDNVGISISDVYAGKRMQLNEEQSNFYLSHKSLEEYYTVENWYNMTEVPTDVINKKIEDLRFSIYSEKTDPLYMSYIKYKETNEMDKANQAYNKWLSEIQKVKEQHPYII